MNAHSQPPTRPVRLSDHARALAFIEESLRRENNAFLAYLVGTARLAIEERLGIRKPIPVLTKATPEIQMMAKMIRKKTKVRS